MELNYIDFMKNGSLFTMEQTTPEDIKRGFIQDLEKVTGMKFVYGSEEKSINPESIKAAKEAGMPEELANSLFSHSKKFEEEFYFLGRLLNYDELKSEFPNLDYSTIDETQRFAVGYDTEGKISEIKRIKDDKKYIALNSIEELRNIYKTKTGQDLQEYIEKESTDTKLTPNCQDKDEGEERE